MLVPLLFLLAATQTVSREATPLRTACDSSSQEVARLNPGDAVSIRYALAGGDGPCYKVSADAGGRQWEGWLTAADLSDVTVFEKARSAGATLKARPPEPEAARPAGQTAVALPAGSGARLMKATELLNSNQPAEAHAVAEAIIKEQGPQPDLLSFAGVAAQRGDRTAQAVQYFQQSLAMKTSPAVERMLASARRELESDRSSEKLFGMRFVFRYDTREVAPEQARSIVPLLDSEFNRISEVLGCRAEERIVVVVQTVDAFRRTTGAAEWAGGQYDGRIRVALLDGGRMGPEARRAFAHEITHACLANLGSFPAWLHEGLAQKLSGDTPPAADLALVKQMARQNQLPSLKRMSGTWSRLSPQHARVAYAAAYQAAEALFEAYGNEGARNLARNPETLARVTVELDRRVRQ